MAVVREKLSEADKEKLAIAKGVSSTIALEVTQLMPMLAVEEEKRTAQCGAHCIHRCRPRGTKLFKIAVLGRASPHVYE
jgi:hypothetical protein